ncbi:Uncharacterised protein [uncultured archaeon]|nr:Uncharacterised protein [uncultured archaeon]
MPKPSVLAAGALEDNGRFLFIKRKNGEMETVELPYAIIPQGSNPVAALTEVFLAQLGIDAQVHETIYETRHNAGSRKNKRWVPALVFRITAKSAFAKPAAGLGYVWLSLDDARGKRLARNSEWMR